MGNGKLSLGTLAYVFVVSTLFLEVQLGAAEVNFGNLILVAGCAFVGLVATRMRSPNKGGVAIIAQDVVFLTYIVFCGTSFFWSAAPLDTVVQSIYLAAIWFAVYGIGSVDTKAIVRSIVYVSFYVAILSFATILLSPESAFQTYATAGYPELRGILKHQQRLGLLMSLAVGLVIVAWLNGDLPAVVGKSKVRAIAVFGVICLCMIAALARSYTVFMMVALGLSILMSRPRKWAVPAIGVGLVIALPVIFYLDSIIGLVGDSEADLTLSGRTIVWQRTSALFQSAQWLGYGYASFYAPAFDHIWGNYRPPHAHNSGLQAVFETGLIGLGLTLLLVLAQVRASVRAAWGLRRYSYSLFVVLLGALASITGVTYAGKPSVLFCLLMLVAGAEARELLAARKAYRLASLTGASRVGSDQRDTGRVAGQDRLGAAA